MGRKIKNKKIKYLMGHDPAKLRFYDDPSSPGLRVCAFCKKAPGESAHPNYCEKYPEGIPEEMQHVYIWSGAKCFAPEE